MLKAIIERLVRQRKVASPSRFLQRGATAVEMALIAPAFFLLLIGTIEMGLMLTAQQLMESAAFNTSRLAKTGYVASGSTQTATVNQILTNELQSFGAMIDPSKVTLTSTAYTSFTNSGSNTGGTSGMGTAQQIVVYTITYPWKLFTPMMSAIIGTGGIVQLSTKIVVRDEPY